VKGTRVTRKVEKEAEREAFRTQQQLKSQTTSTLPVATPNSDQPSKVIQFKSSVASAAKAAASMLIMPVSKEDDSK
jgi:hypothetical protein